MTENKRIIKFRAWQRAHNKMHYNVNLYSMGRGEMIKAQLDNKSFMDSIGLSCEIMQFTDLLDKNGKEIYEDDIVQLGSERLRRVYFKFGAFGYDGIPGFLSFAEHPNALIDIEVIGNIWENPDLIEKK
jgi:uncharacterized phage protein (TIGR01671 family)